MTVARRGISTEKIPSPRWFTGFRFCVFVNLFCVGKNGRARLQMSFRFFGAIVFERLNDEDVRFTRRNAMLPYVRDRSRAQLRIRSCYSFCQDRRKTISWNTCTRI